MTIVGTVTGFLVDKAAGLFTTKVIERWSKKRAEEFVKMFCTEVAKGCDSGDIGQLLDEMMEDDTKSAALFDAYRRVCLSASVKIGPRIIALVTARVVGEARDATSTEEQIMAVAEQLTDKEFAFATKHFDDYVKDLKTVGPHHAYHDPGFEDESICTDLWDIEGGWAAKLGQFGFITHDINIVLDKDDRDGHPQMFRPKLAATTYYDAAYADLVALIKLASPISQTTVK